MLFAATLSAIALATGVAAQSAQNNTIQVGAEMNSPGGIFQFIPSTIAKAPNGTVITFQFTGAPGNHSVTQSSFANPCTPLAGGFDSGWVYIPQAGLGPAPTFNLTITDDSKPIWFYCKQLLPQFHCTSGMVGAINAPTSGANTFAAYQKNAESFKGTPGQSQGALVGVGASASAGIVGVPSGATLFPISTAGAGSASGTASGSAPAGSATAPPASGSGSGGAPAPTGGAMANAASVGSVALAGFLGVLLL